MHDPNLQLLEAAARLLEPLLDDVVFVGGCVTGLLITDAAAADIRPTTDVDMIADWKHFTDAGTAIILGVMTWKTRSQLSTGGGSWSTSCWKPRRTYRATFEKNSRSYSARGISSTHFPDSCGRTRRTKPAYRCCGRDSKR